MTVIRAGSFSQVAESAPDVGGRLAARLCHASAEEQPFGSDTFFGLGFSLAASTSSDPAVVSVPLAALDCDPLWLVWTARPATRREMTGGVGVVATADHVVVHERLPVATPDDLAAATSATYSRLVRRVQALGYPHLVRIWNFVPGINGGSGDEENYLRFNRGRAAVFGELAVPVKHYPAATVVGSPAGTPLTVIMVASRIEPQAIENPRQTSAYHYPRQYGPQPPAFARSMLLPHGTGATLFVSGTASIVGHESRHRQIGPQLAEAFANLQTLKAAAAACLPGHAVQSPGCWLVYLRNPGDREHIAEAVGRELGGRDTVGFLQADICRRELLVEIEGVCELVSAAAPVRSSSAPSERTW
jgi:chorismate lyase/3-hydroxybenzoate synthase